MRYSHIWFDLGYTLLYKKREIRYQSVLAKNGMDKREDEIERAFHLADKTFMRDYPGALSSDFHLVSPWYLGVLNYFLGIKTDLCSISSQWLAESDKEDPLWHAYGNCHEVLRALKAKNISLGVISNWDSTAKPILEANGLIRYFDDIVISSEVGAAKPSEEIFRIAFGKANCDPASCLYVGDNYYDDAVGASKVGMDCIIVNRFGKLGIEELDGVKVIPDIGKLLSCL